ncbi:phage virion morphogenesis protein, putative tail completion [Shewanella psychrophila]|uniref:Phage virion morphogenesis protein, putative tail completion n=1 Tax=Shewanella psychrophila TaxID=225848 RepID=A0A1S6HSS1_9GAMM|nr:phage virion morphogenesis protein [Shewanella psychrophila]AQS38586.1 phage virion morphogenesis protein, putative tail completion [Shewanella psychrophila]
MAGTHIKVEAKGRTAITKALNSLLKQSGNLTPSLGDIGEYLLKSTQQRFIEQQAPDGSPWAELSSTTLERKQRTDRILTESGTLASSIHYQLGRNQLTLGSNEEYAAMQQFGGITSPFSMMPNQDIPARPFLGIAPFERAEVIDILQHHLAKAL